MRTESPRARWTPRLWPASIASPTRPTPTPACPPAAGPTCTPTGATATASAAAVRGQVLTQVARLSPGNVRDLFDGYLPQAGERKLGSNPRPIAVLSLRGDPERGRALFRSPALQCLNCHKLGDEGKELGPDLSAIGKTRSREELLES